jgi:hypothetical protein
MVSEEEMLSYADYGENDDEREGGNDMNEKQEDEPEANEEENKEGENEEPEYGIKREAKKDGEN